MGKAEFFFNCKFLNFAKIFAFNKYLRISAYISGLVTGYNILKQNLNISSLSFEEMVDKEC